MPDVTGELEAALTSAGTLLVWAEKYRHADPTALPGLRRRLLELGDRARRLARTGALEGDAARELLDAVTLANRESRFLIDDHRAGAPYRAAVEARRANDLERLIVLLPAVFTDLRSAAPPPAGFWTPVWQRRGRPLPADEIAAALRAVEAEGVVASSDDLLPGVDPELPGVLLSITRPLGSPLALRYDHGVLPAPCLRLGDDQVLVPSHRLRLAFTVVLAPPDEPLDEWVADPAAYLRELGIACRRNRLVVTG